MFRVSVRRFRQLVTNLSGAELSFDPSKNLQKQTDLVNELEEVVRVSRQGGSDKGKALHKKRGKLFGKLKPKFIFCYFVQLQ